MSAAGISAALAKFGFGDQKKKKDSISGKPAFDSSLKGFYSKYDMKEIIGRGVSGTVRRCVDIKTMTQYAVKTIDLTSISGDEQVDMFRKETLKEIAILQMCCDHSSIIHLRDAYESPVYFFLVFDLLTKGELFDYMTQIVTMSEKRTRQVMSQLFSAVSYIHSKKIVHRDIKPENILLDENLNIKLADFGIAAVVSHDEELRDLVGTPGYLAPEVIRCSMFERSPGYGRPVDCWASGVVMYSLLCGSPPFWHRRQLIMLRSIMEGSYNFNNPEWGDVRDICKDLVSRLLVVSVEDRLTAVEALSHPFFHPDGASATEIYLFVIVIGELYSAFSREPTQKEVLSVLVMIVVTADSKISYGRRRFKVAVYAAIAIIRLQKLHLIPPEIELSQLRTDPYSIRLIRKLVDNGAFRIYGHWVQKGEVQNRALLFDNELRKSGAVLRTIYQ